PGDGFCGFREYLAVIAAPRATFAAGPSCGAAWPLRECGTWLPWRVERAAGRGVSGRADHQRHAATAGSGGGMPASGQVSAAGSQEEAVAAPKKRRVTRYRLWASSLPPSSRIECMAKV